MFYSHWANRAVKPNIKNKMEEEELEKTPLKTNYELSPSGQYVCLICQKDIIDAKRRVSLWDGDVVSAKGKVIEEAFDCLLYTSPSPRDGLLSRMPSSA